MEIDSYKREIDQLKREKESLQFQIENMESFQLNSDSLSSNSETKEITKDSNLLSKELHLLREQTNQKLAEFDSLKVALFKDLENRCQKVIELEMLLDEAREQYQSLLAQVKNSNSKALQQKCIFLQRNLEQLTNAQQQFVNENNRLKLENQVFAKQLDIRNERIHGLDLLLQDTQEKLQKYAASENRAINTKKVTSNILPHSGRVAKPIRGGGGGAVGPPTTMTTPSGSKVTISAGSIRESPVRERSSSIWDMFRSSKKLEEPVNELPN